MRTPRTAISMLLFVFAAICDSQVQAQQFQSCEVNSDRTVTFRLAAANAKSVSVKIARTEIGEIELQKGNRGRWEGNSPPMPPGIYEYTFTIDGTSALDPRNRWTKEWYSLMSMFEIPGSPPLVTEHQQVPHGTLHHHTYKSTVTSGDRKLVDYTPPGYEADSDRTYPVVYLLHGFGDDQTAWIEVGRAHYIADNLIASTKIQPLVIVMPYGHPEPLPYGQRDPEYGPKNDDAMERDILQNVKQLVAKTYRVSEKPNQSAIVGLSMGGGHSLRIGLRNPEHFSWIGAFSAAAPAATTVESTFPEMASGKAEFKKIWIACGEDDFLLERNQSFTAKLTELGVTHEYLETEGSHNWDVWRDYLPQFLQLIFK